MKTKQEIRQSLIKEFGENFNTINNLIAWLKKHYHPQIFTSMSEFVKTPYFHIKGEMTIDEYTDDYITENDAYIIVLFDNPKDFKFKLDDYHDDVVICYDDETKKVLKYYYTGYYNDVLEYIQNFVDNNGIKI